MKLCKDFRRKARYCEYPECSNNKDEKDLNACMRCKLVHYCCKEHQRLHWPEHKKNCKELCEGNKDLLGTSNFSLVRKIIAIKLLHLHIVVVKIIYFVAIVIIILQIVHICII